MLIFVLFSVQTSLYGYQKRFYFKQQYVILTKSRIEAAVRDMFFFFEFIFNFLLCFLNYPTN